MSVLIVVNAGEMDILALLVDFLSTFGALVYATSS